MMTENTVQPNTENRLLGALAHASIMAQGLGILVGVLVYLNQRDKSRYVAFQALQAAVYQVFALAVTIGSWIIWGIFYGLTFIWMIPAMEAVESNGALPPIFWVNMGSMGVPFLLMLIVGIIGLIAALQTWRGKDYRYPVIGGMLERSGLWDKPAE
jgi:uncharacterized Tic20 family protein